MLDRAQIDHMFHLANDHAPEAKAELAGRLANTLMSGAENLSLRESELLNELLTLLASSSRSPAFRQMLARQFIRRADAPRPIALAIVDGALTHESKDTLLQNKNLRDTDLVELVRSHGAGHAGVIAARARISEAVADALITTGDPEVMTIVAHNLGARLSQAAMMALVEAARYTATLREPAAARPELDAKSASKLYWWISPDLRREVLARTGATAGMIDEALLGTIQDILSGVSQDDPAAVKAAADWLESRQLNAAILIKLLRLGYRTLFTELLSRWTRLGTDKTKDVLKAQSGAGMAVLGRYLGISSAEFASLFLLSRAARDDDHIVHPREVTHTLAVYGRLSEKEAADLVDTWRNSMVYIPAL